MSWLNNSLNTIKGQLTTLAQEVLAETAGPGDDEYRASPEADTRTALELLADTQKENDDLDKLCKEKENEIVLLRKQIAQMQNKISDSGGGGGNATSPAAAIGSGAASGRTSKSSTDNNAALEDSWCWEPENVKSENDHSSETSSGNGNEMVNITLEEIPLGGSSSKSKRGGRHKLDDLPCDKHPKRIQQLEDENKRLNAALEELDSQHNQAMQDVLELKNSLQESLAQVTKNYETLKKEHTEKFINAELETGNMKQQLDRLEKERQVTEVEKQSMEKTINDMSAELKKAIEEMADLQILLDKKTQDNLELIERVKVAGKQVDTAEEERLKLLHKFEQLEKEMGDSKMVKTKKTSESSGSSVGKHSDDEFIVVREGDSGSSGPTTPPTKEELKDKIVELENRVSELTLENGSLSLKLQDREMEMELSVSVLKENLQMLQTKYDEQEVQLKAAAEQLEEQKENLMALKEKAADSIIAREEVKALMEEKQKNKEEIDKLEKSVNTLKELETRLLISEQEKESLQIELESLRSAQERVAELEGKIQKINLENQQFKLNAEAETEVLNNSAELEDKLSSLSQENDRLRSEIDSMISAKFRQAIAEEKTEITDLDEDADEFSMENLRDLLNAYVKGDLSGCDEADVEKVYNALRERLSKIDGLEKNLSQVTEELMDLQDNKLVWNHEKKTLEADISQYILQCDDLMKNNEILLNELENYKHNKLETIPENNEEHVLHLELQLEECSKLNRTLEQEYAEVKEKLDELERENQNLTEKLRSTQQSNESLNVERNDYKLQLETLELEKSNLVFELNELISKKENDADKNEEEQKSENLENQLTRLSKDHADLVAAMQSQKAALLEATAKREEAETALAGHQSIVEDLKSQLAEKVRQEFDKDSKLENLIEEVSQLKQDLLAKDIAIESLKNELKIAEDRLLDFDGLMLAKIALEKELYDNHDHLRKLQDKLQAKVHVDSATDIEEFEKVKSAKEALEKEHHKLRDLYETKCLEMQVFHDRLLMSGDPGDEDDSEARLSKIEAQLKASNELHKTIDTLTFEKTEMIKVLQQKHSENMQYYAEIQRLQSLIQELQQQQQQQQTAAAAEVRACDKCPTLEATVAELRKEHEKLQDQINFLKEKSDILTTNLLTEQTNQKLIQQEKADVVEQNAAIRKDLERLREHLLEIEDMHTQETIEMQRELEETKVKMIELQEQVSKSSNAYTSASIRANQHAETLQAQHVLVVQQRDELVAKLSLAEDRESKNQAALCNLQCALEQFQNDKENDIKEATQRIRKELQHELDKQTQLQLEITSLNQQLADANQGLQAASRLSDQLEACQQTIAVLREEVDTLLERNTVLENQLKTSESSQTDKIDKNLIKSLLIGYVVSGNPNDKNQVLRMISSVLDFTQTESDKIGLNKQQTSWLGTILGGAGAATSTSNNSSTQGAHSKENLVQAFVQFLEQESQPKVDISNMPNLLNITQVNPSQAAVTNSSTSSRRTSVASNSGGGGGGITTTTPIPIQPLLLNTNIMDEFAPTRNSSSILKDILSDS